MMCFDKCLCIDYLAEDLAERRFCGIEACIEEKG